MQDKVKKKNVLNPNPCKIGRRELLKSAVAVTGGYAAASIAEPNLWAGIPNSSSADTRAGSTENGFPSADLIAKIKSGRRIDVHQHVVLPEYEKALAKQGVVENSNLKVKVFTKDSVLAVMAELGMDATVLLPFSTSGIYLFYLPRTASISAIQPLMNCIQR